jgi:hypothetical protein
MDLRKIAFKCPNAKERFPRFFNVIRDNTDVEETIPTSFPGQRDGPVHLGKTAPIWETGDFSRCLQCDQKSCLKQTCHARDAVVV